MVRVGMSDSEIASQLGLYATHVSRFRKNKLKPVRAKQTNANNNKKADVPLARRAKPVASDRSQTTQGAIDTLLGRGESESTISREMGVGISAVRRIATLRGLDDGSPDGTKVFGLSMQGWSPDEITAETGIDLSITRQLRFDALALIKKDAGDEEALAAMVRSLVEVGASAQEISECLSVDPDDAWDTARLLGMRVSEVSESPINLRRREARRLSATLTLPEVAENMGITVEQVAASLDVDPWFVYGAEAMELTMHGMDGSDIRMALKVSEDDAHRMWQRSQYEIAQRNNNDEWLGRQIVRLASWGVSFQNAVSGLGVTAETVGRVAKGAGVPTDWYLTTAEKAVNAAILDLMADTVPVMDIAVQLKLDGPEEVRERLAAARLDFDYIASEISRQKIAMLAEQIRNMVSKGATAVGVAEATGIDEDTLREIAKRHNVRFRRWS